jgi:hypothetical protein
MERCKPDTAAIYLHVKLYLILYFMFNLGIFMLLA